VSHAGDRSAPPLVPVKETGSALTPSLSANMNQDLFFCSFRFLLPDIVSMKEKDLLSSAA
jgi:hypothetical protein